MWHIWEDFSKEEENKMTVRQWLETEHKKKLIPVIVGPWYRIELRYHVLQKEDKHWGDMEVRHILEYPRENKVEIYV